MEEWKDLVRDTVNIPDKLAAIFDVDVEDMRQIHEVCPIRVKPGDVNFYELALLLADGQSRHSENRWGSFIDNLSRICDEFATQIARKEKLGLAALESMYRNYGRIGENLIGERI